VLSGTGSDGTLGVRAIKGEGGMAMVQNPETTEYDGMPRSAIATGLVDYVMSPAEMPAQLVSFVTHAFGNAMRPTTIPLPKDDSQMKKIFILLRAQTGHDFSGYKQSTINRRTQRRMAVLQIDRLEEYVRFLQKNPDEVAVLFNDFLINVTSFFRDSEAFAQLQDKVIPKLFAGKNPGDFIRVWVPGCSTGEEAYSIAILLQEHMESLKQYFKLQVFATDIDPKAVGQARSGSYPGSIAADVSAERLAKFFTFEPDKGVYRIHKGTRDILIFSEQDLVKDPPFSRLDLISCRNLLIYLSGELQKKIIPLFHYALNPGGFLFLGTSETVGEFGDLFTTLDRPAKLYQNNLEDFGRRRPNVAPFLPLQAGGAAAAKSTGPASASETSRDRFRELTEQALLQQFAASGVLVGETGDILYLHGRTGRYLEPAPGEAHLNILKMAREGLQRKLAGALHKAALQKAPVRQENLRVKTNGGFSNVHMNVQQVKAAAGAAAGRKLFLVTLEEAASARVHPSEQTTDTDLMPTNETGLVDQRLAYLQQELRDKAESLQSAMEELETSNEELKSSNEEMQSVNEELQSTNEELETSKEELQSVNEELSTVNAEQQSKVVELSLANNDMNNLLAGTGVGTIFLDHQQRIRRFTPTVVQLINLIPTDVGRPVGHIVSNLTGYNSFVEDVQSVLDSLVPKEVEVQTRQGAWFMLRIRPYRTLENVIEGVVVVFFDITEMKRVQQELMETSEKQQVLFDTMPQGVLFQDAGERIIEANPAAQRILGMSLEQMKGKGFIQPRWKTVREDGGAFPADEQPARLALRTGQAAQGVVMGVAFPHKASIAWLRVNSIPLFKPGGTTPYQVYATFDEITDIVGAGPAT
jgi:two-component system CheB/CheR fusion protein